MTVDMQDYHISFANPSALGGGCKVGESYLAAGAFQVTCFRLPARRSK
jgi:hypothetical protein